MQLPVVHCVLIEQFSLKMAIALDEPTLLDNVLYYGLFVGAIFQLICIFAVVFIPQSENEDEVQEPSESKSNVPSPPPPSSSKKTKREKKKHR